MRDEPAPATTPSPSLSPARRRPPATALEGRPILLATDGSACANAAARVTAALATERRAVPHVLRVLDLSAYAIPAPLPGIVIAADVMVGREVRAPDADALRAELGRLVGRAVAWPVATAIGSPARAILEESARFGADLVVMGIRHHDFVERALRDETTLAVMRRSACPVLGVTPALDGLPRRALVGTDFGRASTAAARAALSVLAPGGRLLLAYVQPPHFDDGEPGEGAAMVRELGIHAAFKRVIGDLEREDGVTIEPVIAECTPGVGTAGELLALGDRTQADLLVVGSQRHVRFDRWLLGSVTTDLARDGRHSLLVVPPHREPEPTPRR